MDLFEGIEESGKMPFKEISVFVNINLIVVGLRL